MADRSVATMLREIAQVRAAPLDEATKAILVARLKAEVAAVADAFSRQRELELKPGAVPLAKPR